MRYFVTPVRNVVAKFGKLWANGRITDCAKMLFENRSTRVFETDEDLAVLQDGKMFSTFGTVDLDTDTVIVDEFITLVNGEVATIVLVVGFTTGPHTLDVAFALTASQTTPCDIEIGSPPVTSEPSVPRRTKTLMMSPEEIDTMVTVLGDTVDPDVVREQLAPLLRAWEANEARKAERKAAKSASATPTAEAAE